MATRRAAFAPAADDLPPPRPGQWVQVPLNLWHEYRLKWRLQVQRIELGRAETMPGGIAAGGYAIYAG